MKIFSRIATLVSIIFLIAATVFNFYHGMWIMGILTIVFMAILVCASIAIGVWKRGQENW